MIEALSLIRNVSVTMIVKGGAVVIGILAVPAYLDYFNNQAALGIWFSILAVLNWILFFDLGLGNGLKNSLIIAISSGNYGEAKDLIIKSYLILILISVFAIASILVLYFISRGFSDFPAENVGIEIAGFETALLILGITIVIQFPLRLVISVLLALQKSAIASFIPFLSQLLILCFLVLVHDLSESERFIYLVVVYGFSMCVPLIAATVYVGLVTSGWPSGQSKYMDIRGMLPVMVSGSKFFWIQLCLLAVNGSNEFLILNFHSPQDVVAYQIYFRVFSVFLVGFSTLTVPLWSAIGQASVLKNSSRIYQIERALKYSVLVALVAMAGLCVILPAVFNLWLGHGVVTTDYQVVMLFSIYTFVMIGIMYGACIANGFNELRGQLIFLTMAVVVKFVGLYFYKAEFLSWSGIVLLTIVSLLPAFCYLIYESHRLTSSLDRSVALTFSQKANS